MSQRKAHDRHHSDGSKNWQEICIQYYSILALDLQDRRRMPLSRADAVANLHLMKIHLMILKILMTNQFWPRVTKIFRKRFPEAEAS